MITNPHLHPMTSSVSYPPAIFTPAACAWIKRFFAGRRIVPDLGASQLDPLLMWLWAQNNACGLLSTREATCWGDNTYGQSNVPIGTFAHIAAGSYSTCGIRENGGIECWGWDTWRTTYGGGVFTAVVVGYEHICGLGATGLVACQGDNARGQLSAPSDKLIDFSAGSYHTCGIRENGSVTCWGGNLFGQSLPPHLPSE